MKVKKKRMKKILSEWKKEEKLINIHFKDYNKNIDSTYIKGRIVNYDKTGIHLNPSGSLSVFAIPYANILYIQG